jgi:hypothetical protein
MTGIKRACIAAVIAGTLSAADAAAQTITFTARSVARLYGSPVDVTPGDFNNDGRLDFAVVGPSLWGGTASVYEALGADVFAHNTYDAGTVPSAILAVDLNHDAALDLVVANVESNQISVLVNTGLGSLGPRAAVATGAGPTALAAGDFNRDGNADVVTANARANTISILLGNGRGGFGTVRAYATGAQPTAVTTDDFNCDGKLDLAIANGGSGSISVRLGAGNGTFGSAVRFAVAGAPTDIAVGDFNGDGIRDGSCAHPFAASISARRMWRTQCLLRQRIA